MISIFKSRINVNHDSLQMAIQKKINNNALSNKSINKIIKIANTQYSLKSGEAEYIFLNKNNMQITSQEFVTKLINNFKGIRTNNASDFMSAQIKSWEKKASQALLPVQQELIGKGSRGEIYKDGSDFIIKKLLTTSNEEIAHEANMCNAYNLMRGETTNVATITGGCIRMPFLSGGKPSFQDVFDGVEILYQMGFMIADARPSNFLKREGGEVIPIDFGLIFKRDELDNINSSIKKEIVHDYVKGGYEYIPSNLIEEYTSCIKKLDISLADESQLGQMKVKELMNAGLLY